MRAVRKEIEPAKNESVITPEQLAKSGSEHAHQMALMQWCAQNVNQHAILKRLFAVPNGGERSASVAASMRAEGVKPGVPDLCLPAPMYSFAGLYIEMKRPELAIALKGGLSKDQEDWIKYLLDARYAVVVCYGWQAAVEAIKDYLSGNIRQDGQPFTRYK